VQGVLAARIDWLPADVKTLLQTLAVLGKEFAWSRLPRWRISPGDSADTSRSAEPLGSK